MNVSLTPELERYIASKVEGGLYGSASEVVREALRRLKASDEAQRSQIDALRQDVKHGWQRKDDGPAVPAETVIADLRRRTDALRHT